VPPRAATGRVHLRALHPVVSRNSSAQPGWDDGQFGDGRGVLATGARVRFPPGEETGLIAEPLALVHTRRVFVRGCSSLHQCCQVELSLYVLERSQPRALLRFSWRLWRSPGPSATGFYACRCIEYSHDHRVVQGYADGCHLERVVTRDQMAALVARAFKPPT